MFWIYMHMYLYECFDIVWPCTHGHSQILVHKNHIFVPLLLFNWALTYNNERTAHRVPSFRFLFISLQRLHPQNHLHYDPLWMSHYALSSCCCIYLPSTPWTLCASRTSYPPCFVFRGQHSTDTISNQESYWFEPYYIDLSLLLAWKTSFLSFGFLVPVIQFQSQLRHLCFTLSQSSFTSFVSLMWDLCYPLSFPQGCEKLRQCSVTPWLWIVYENNIAYVSQSLDRCAVTPRDWEKNK